MYVLRDYYRLSINVKVLTKGEDYLLNELQPSNLVMKRPDCQLVLAFCYPAHKVMHKGIKSVRLLSTNQISSS